jgi:hypothetical protein
MTGYQKFLIGAMIFVGSAFVFDVVAFCIYQRILFLIYALSQVAYFVMLFFCYKTSKGI